jgi:hypothetical protein
VFDHLANEEARLSLLLFFLMSITGGLVLTAADESAVQITLELLQD